MYKPKILAFAGSLRSDSLNKKLIKIAVKGAREAGADVTLIDLKDYPLPIFDQDIQDKQGFPENAIKLKELMCAHDGFLLSCPEYNSSISGVLKNVIDWTSRQSSPEEAFLSCYTDKVIVLMSASPSQLGGLRGLVHVRAMLTNMFSIVLPQQKSITQADSAFNPDGSLINSRHDEEVKELGRLLTHFLEKHKGEVLANH